MNRVLMGYVNKFNADDNEHYKAYVDNACVGKWMLENVPLIDIPDKTIEEIYYFRWWVFRKHIKNTEDGYLITEFLPDVLWGGKHNTIIAAAGYEQAFEKLELKDGFYSKFGFTTAEQRHPRYLYKTRHECMWNGDIWPFATSQTLR